MKPSMIAIVLALVFGAIPAQAQIRVSVSVGIATPHVVGRIVVGRPHYHIYPRTVVVIGGPRVHRHSARVIVVRQAHSHRRHHHHRYHRGACGGGYGCR